MLRDFQIVGEEFRTVEYADGFVLLEKEESVLENIVNTVIEIVRCYGIEMNKERK
jgi:hypothetical protein